MSDYIVNPIKKSSVSEFPMGQALVHFQGGPVKKRTLHNMLVIKSISKTSALPVTISQKPPTHVAMLTKYSQEKLF